MMSDRFIRYIIDVVETWNSQKTAIVQEFTQGDMTRFVETMNDRTRHLISLFGVKNPEFYTGLLELAQNACTLTTPGAQIVADGKNVTNL